MNAMKYGKIEEAGTCYIRRSFTIFFLFAALKTKLVGYFVPLIDHLFVTSGSVQKGASFKLPVNMVFLSWSNLRCNMQERLVLGSMYGFFCALTGSCASYFSSDWWHISHQLVDWGGMHHLWDYTQLIWTMAFLLNQDGEPSVPLRILSSTLLPQRSRLTSCYSGPQLMSIAQYPHPLSYFSLVRLWQSQRPMTVTQEVSV